MARRLPAPRIPKLLDLYLEAQAAYWGPIVDNLVEDGRIDPEFGVQPADLAGIPEFEPLEEFEAALQARGIVYRR